MLAHCTCAQLTAAGEYLCPICRRLGNCLLPAPPPPVEREAPAAGALQQPSSPHDALHRLRQLALDDASWAAAPATAKPQLLQQWQQAQSSVDSDSAAEDSLQLLPVFGSLAADVEALSDSACFLASSWIVQQQQALSWLRARGKHLACLAACFARPPARPLACLPTHRRR